MPSSRFFPSRVQSFYKWAKLLSFPIVPDGSSAPSLLPNLAQGVASVVRTGAGVLVVTLQDQWPAIITAQATCQYAVAPGSGTLLVASFGLIDVVNAKTVTVYTADPSSGNPTDMAGAAGNQINIDLLLLQEV